VRQVVVGSLTDLRVDALARDVARLLAEFEAPGATGPDPRPLKL